MDELLFAFGPRANEPFVGGPSSAFGLRVDGPSFAPGHRVEVAPLDDSGTRAAPAFVLCASPRARELYAEIDTPGGPRGDSGTDLRFVEDVHIPPTLSRGGLPVVVDLEVRVRCAWGGKFVPFVVTPRSSIAKTPLGLANSIGVFDRSYQGSVRLALRNFGVENWLVHRGEALFQLVAPGLEPACLALASDEHPAFADATVRAAGGFGSTGFGGGGAPTRPAPASDGGPVHASSEDEAPLATAHAPDAGTPLDG